MTKLDPIIGVKNVEASSKWYQHVFNCTNKHGGSEFDVLVSESDEVLLCLHKWNEHEHPTMQDSTITAGNGLMLYFRTKHISRIRDNLRSLKHEVEKEIEVSQNSHVSEFSVRDLDGYYLTISEYHNY